MEKISVSRLSFRRKGSWRHKDKEKNIEEEEEFDFSKMSYIGQEEHQSIHEDLLSEYMFSLDQLKEWSGYSCAVAIAKCYPLSSLTKHHGAVLVCCGPGNRGGDGLVCARHLKLFGYKPSIFCPKQDNKPLLKALALQCERLDIPRLSFFPTDSQCILDSFNFVVDALCEVTARPSDVTSASNVMSEFASVLDTVRQIQDRVPVCCIDVPSGWDVEHGNADGIQPDLLISLIAPKLCTAQFRGRKHFLGGRFVPPCLGQKYNLRLPPYPATDTVVEVKVSHPEDETH